MDTLLDEHQELPDSKKMMRFCRECNNLLHPKENRDTQQLEFVCKLPGCNYVGKLLNYFTIK